MVQGPVKRPRGHGTRTSSSRDSSISRIDDRRSSISSVDSSSARSGVSSDWIASWKTADQWLTRAHRIQRDRQTDSSSRSLGAGSKSSTAPTASSNPSTGQSGSSGFSIPSSPSPPAISTIPPAVNSSTGAITRAQSLLRPRFALSDSPSGASTISTTSSQSPMEGQRVTVPRTSVSESLSGLHISPNRSTRGQNSQQVLSPSGVSSPNGNSTRTSEESMEHDGLDNPGAADLKRLEDEFLDKHT